MEPTARETESHQVAKFLLLLLPEEEQTGEMRAAAVSAYGRAPMCDIWTAHLCSLLSDLEASCPEQAALILSGKSVTSAELNLWWVRHKEFDRKRQKEEAENRENEKLRQTALSKLTEEEKKALGI